MIRAVSAVCSYYLGGANVTLADGSAHFLSYPAQKEVTQALDRRRYPDLVLDEDKLTRYNLIGAEHRLIHGFKSGQTEAVAPVRSLEEMGRADAKLVDFTVKKIREFSRGDKPFFLGHCFMKVHADNFANPDYEGKSASKFPYKDASSKLTC